MSDVLWLFLLAQMFMGAFDTFYHHEFTQRLAWRPAQAGELKLHGVRNLAYAVVFSAIGLTEPRGGYALALLGLMLAELVVTLWDFVEEDRTRLLPASERVLHTLLTLNYGVVLAGIAPWLWRASALPTGVAVADHGVWSWLCGVAAFGVVVSGVRDLVAARRAARIVPAPAAPLAAALGGRRSVLVTGATGFVGSRLVEALVAAGHDVTVLARSPAKAAALGAPLRIVTSLDQVPNDARIGAVVNLAGEPIGDARWTEAKRRRIVDSRVGVTREVVGLMARLDAKPDVLISGSAVGWYGVRDDGSLDEASAGVEGFSRDVCVAWEKAAMEAETLGVRVVRLRIGIVLGAEGGLLARLLTPFEFGLGGPIGSGSQAMSWIHRDDLVRLIAHALALPGLSGAVNATAPEPVTNAEFAAALGRALRRPAALRLPAAPLRWALGDLASELLLSGQRVLPKATLASGFAFRHPRLDDALDGIVGRTAAAALTARRFQDQLN